MAYPVCAQVVLVVGIAAPLAGCSATEPPEGLTPADVESQVRDAQPSTATVATSLKQPYVHPRRVVATRWRDAHVLETVAKKDGQVVGYGTYEVSADGKTLTATVAGVDGAGERFEQVIVFDRG